MTALTAVCLTTFAVCLAGSIIPLINTEIYLVSAVALSPPTYMAPLVVTATLGQMAGKVAMFYGGRGILRIRQDRVRNGVATLRERLEGRAWTARVLLFSSATVGLPPLYLMSIACGTIGMSIATFLVLGTAGRLIHFAFVALLPQYAKLLLG